MFLNKSPKSRTQSDGCGSALLNLTVALLSLEYPHYPSLGGGDHLQKEDTRSLTD